MLGPHILPLTHGRNGSDDWIYDPVLRTEQNGLLPLSCNTSAKYCCNINWQMGCFCMCNADDAPGMIGQNYRKVVAIGQHPNVAYNLQGFVKM